MNDIVVEGIAEKQRLVAFCETFASNPAGRKNPLVQEAKIYFSDEGMYALAVDAANVCMVGPATLAPRGFEHFDATGKATVGVNLTALVDRLDPAGKTDLVSFEIDMETRHMNLAYGSADVSIALIDPDSVRQEPDVPDIDLPNTVVLEGSALSHAVEVTGMVSDHLFLEGHPDEREVVFRGKGDVDDATVAYGDDDTLDGTKVSESCESVFSLDYLKALTHPIPDDAEVTVKFGDEFPATLSWDTFDGAFTVNQNVAPRIQSR